MKLLHTFFKAASHSNRRYSIAVSCILCLTTTFYGYGQTKVDLIQAKTFEGNRKEGYTKFVNDVIFKHDETFIYCDSAYLYRDKNVVEAYGRVRIVDGDSVTVTAKRLEYEGNKKLAKLRDNVVFTKLGTATLYTDNLDYNRPQSLAYYFNGGRLVDSINVLTSRKGYYDLNTNMASFKRNVNVKNPDYTMTSDSLQYNSNSKIIYFRTKTKVVNKDGSSFDYEGGEYNTNTKTSDLRLGQAETPSYTMVGKNYLLDDARKVYKVRGDVAMTSKEENLIIYGQSVDNYKALGITKIYNKAWVAKVTDDNDTLFMKADTLVSIDNQVDPSKKRLLAYHNVKIFKKDLQGVADSLEYRSADSTIYFYKNPVLWTDDNQMIADSIKMLIKNNKINRIYLTRNSFVISQDTLFNFNQIKGRRMVAEFVNDEISRVLVEGNGESIYYALDEKSPNYIGMNRIICSNIIIRFKNGKVNNLSFYVNPDANFIPPHELKKEDKTLKDFRWEKDKRPKRQDVVGGSTPSSLPDKNKRERL